MMRLSSVSEACEEAVCSQQNLPLPSPTPCSYPPQTNERWQAAVQPSPLELPLVLQIPLAPGHEPQCTKLFLSTDIKYLDLL